jgi:hypothetical protein
MDFFDDLQSDELEENSVHILTDDELRELYELGCKIDDDPDEMEEDHSF